MRSRRTTTASAQPSTPPRSSSARSAVRRPSWPALVAWTAVVPTLVMLPLLGLPARADKRFHLYDEGSRYYERPWALVGDQIRLIPDHLDLGNFRPLGRIVEHTQDMVAFALADALRLPVHVPMRALGFLAIAVVAVLTLLLSAALLSAQPVASAPPAPVLAVTPLAVAVVTVAAAPQSAVTLYTDLYFTSAALTLAAALWAARSVHLRSPSMPLGAAVLAAVGGFGLAAFNELAYLAPPTAIAAVTARGLLTMRLPWRTWLRSAAVKLVAVASVAFAVVFVPIRFEIARRCADGSCYVASDLDVSGMTVGLFGHRISSWWPPSAWHAAVGEHTEGSWYLTRNPVLLLVALVLAVAGIAAVRSLCAPADGTVRGAVALAAVAGVLLVLPALLATGSAGNQELWHAGWEAGAGWRDTAYYVPGVALLVTATSLAVTLTVRDARRFTRCVVVSGLVGLLVLGAWGTLGANKTFTYRVGRHAESVIHARVALAMVHFAATPEGDRDRCELLDEFATVQSERRVRQLTQAVDTAARIRYGVAFCADGG
jgi:hypothetical protein